MSFPCKKPNAFNKAKFYKESSCKIFSFPLWIVISTLILVHPCTALKPPDIMPSDDTQLLVKGQQLELTCHGDKPLVWTFSNFHVETDPRLNVTSFEDESLPRKYSSTLVLDNVQHTDAGIFICSYEDPETTSEDEKHEDFVSVYVEDVDHLLIHPNQTVYNVRVGSTLVLPCRTSWPDVNIQIFDTSNNDKPIHLNSTNYSKLNGLTIDNYTNTHFWVYTCNATYKNKSDTLKFNVLSYETTTFATSWFPPTIKAPSSVAVGSRFTVRCSTEQHVKTYYKLELIGPAADYAGMKDEHNHTRVQRLSDYYIVPDKKAYYTELFIHEARKEDAGNYTCKMIPSKIGSSQPAVKIKTKEVKVFEEGDTFLNVFTEVENITVRKDDTAKWVINISSFPLDYEIEWKRPTGQKIDFKSEKFAKVKTSKDGEFSLQVRVATLDDMGPYPFTVKLPGRSVSKTLNLFLTVKAPPLITMEPSGTLNCPVGTICSLKCTVKAYPPATIRWSWEPCTPPSKCISTTVKEKTRKAINNGVISVIEFNGTEHGVYTCFATNSRNGTLDTRKVRIVDNDYRENGPISIIVKPEEVVDGDDVELICAVSKLDGNNHTIEWDQIVGESVKPISSELIKGSETKWSQRKTIHIKAIKKSATGTYRCSTNDASGNRIKIVKHLTVFDEAMPEIEHKNLGNKSRELKLGDSLNLTCNVKGRPKPVLTWTLDDLGVSEWPPELKYEFHEENSILLLKYVPLDAQGRYQCKAQNRNGTALAFVDISVTGARTFSNWAVAAIMILLILVVIFGVILAKYKYKQGEMKRFMREISQKDFNNGAVENINPELSVTDQAYLLPYDNAWEFPKDRLKLGMELGSGAFGRVVKAEAIGILDFEPKTTVAVKMVKPNADHSHFKALMSELKIMVHLGKHVNVVNLLGACTANLAKKKELYVIVEYCKYGSLLSYMHRNKGTFINQLDLARGIIDPTIDRPIDRNSEMSQAQRKPASNGYRTLDEFHGPNPDEPMNPNARSLEHRAELSDGGYLTPNRRSTEHYVAESHAESAMTGMTYLSNGHTLTDGTTKRRSSCGSQWQDHYRGDYQAREVQPIRTTDLLCWAFQIAMGMDYLASRKVLHGDLAARNVLLAENNVVKICDFGLAKEMYKDYKYKKKSEGLLPVKWMAIESIFYGVFSTQSDCWSYGVVLWELFTLGKTPYAGMETDDKFYQRLNEGYRMEKPVYAPSCVYDIMLECWAHEATERPTFSALVDRIGDMMSEGLRNHYIDLNADYMRINQTYLANRPDYLLQMGRTDFSTDSATGTSERRYQNVSEEVDASGYLKPIPFQSPPPVSPSTSTPQYQNIQQNLREPMVVAVNNGYQYISKVPESPVDTRQSDPSSQQEIGKPNVELHIDCPPDIRDLYNLREDSTSPDRNSLTEGELDDKHVNIDVGNDGIRGVDNMNYVPNYMLFNNKSKTSLTEPSNLANGTAENSRRQKRQKNDSGLGSIDSTQFDQHKFNSHDSHHAHYSELGHLQDSKGYVTHHNITSLS